MDTGVGWKLQLICYWAQSFDDLKWAVVAFRELGIRGPGSNDLTMGTKFHHDPSAYCEVRVTTGIISKGFHTCLSLE